MKWKILSALAICGVLLVLVAFASTESGDPEFEAARELIVMRKIAHDVLLYAGDSTSRILPVNKLSDNEFQIPFESSFSFKPDSLVRIIDQVIAGNKLSSNYIVNVLEPKSNKVIFGYAILGKEQNSIVPCIGRDQPAKLYTIQIKLQGGGFLTTNRILLVGLGILLVMAGLLGYQRFRKPVAAPVVQQEDPGQQRQAVPLGDYIFYPDELVLANKSGRTVLTNKETKLLRIFASHPNQVIERSRLQKEVWEDEGVIVGRSLDMFISKLRKKLEQDPGVKLVNIHGKGYKLEIAG